MSKLGRTIKSMLFIAMTFFLLEFCPQIVNASDVMVSEDPYTGQVLKVRVDGNNGTLIYFRSSADAYTIPATIRGFQNTTVTITGIKKEAFRGCASLRTLTIPDTVTSIGEYAFMDCHNLTTVHMPARLENLGKGAFSNCNRLQSIIIPDGITAIGDATFSGCSHLAVIRFPNGITHIGSSAFGDCSSLTTITLPSSINYIGPYAFHNCALRSIVIPSGVTRIYEGTFKNCTTLTQVTISEGITTIEDFAFQGCSSLAGIGLPDSLRGMGMFVFKDCRALKSIALPGKLTKIEIGMFENCSSLTSVSIPSSVTEMKGVVFRGCTSLKSIAIPDSVKCFEGGTFAGCTSLESIKFSAKDPAINSEQFLNCTSLRSITIPEHIIFLGDRAFKGCTNLTEVKFLGNAPHPYDFGFNVFDNCAPDFKIKYILGKSGWSNPFHGYPAEAVADLKPIPEAAAPVHINPDALGNIPAGITADVLTLKAQAGVGFVRLDWNSISDSRGVAGYNVYKTTSPGSQPVTPAANHIKILSYIDPDVQTGTTYYYTVKPVFVDNSVGTASNEVAAAPKESSGTIQLTIDNPVMSGNGVMKEIDSGFGTAPVIKEGRTFLPIRALITEMGGNIEWDGTQQKVTIDFDGIMVELWIGQMKARVDGAETSMTAAPFISATGRTMLPLRFVGESLGCNVSWDDAARMVTVTYDTAAEKTDTLTPSVGLPSGVPSSLPAPTISNLELLTYDDGVPYFRLQVTVPANLLTLDQQHPADGWVNLETDGKIDDGEWGVTGGGGGHLDLFADPEYAVPGKTNTYYISYDVEDEGGLTETIINARKYSYRLRFNYTYYYGDGETNDIYSPWSNELSGQTESYYRSIEE